MNTASRSDASTSTDDVRGRPLCLFYFTHPFGVLSPEAPRVFDMESAPPFCWPSATDSYRSSSPTPPAPAPPPPPMGSARAVRRGPPLLDSLSSSEAWSCSSGRRYARILPPLRLPSPRDLVDYSSDDVWPCRRPPPRAARFSLPPIELPLPLPLPPPVPAALHPALPPPAPAAPTEPRARRSRPFPSGVDKHRRHYRRRRVRAGDLRRLLTRLIRRSITEGRVCRESSASASASASCSPAPALRRALHTLRDAWAAPAPAPPARHYDTTYNRSAVCCKKSETSEVPRNPETVVMSGTQAQDGVGRMDASPGLLRRRYSVPETIMRKYRLAQQCSESEEATSCARHSASSASGPDSPSASASASASGPRDRFLRRDRELMRKSALLRRLWARPVACACCESRSLTGSRSELRRSPAASPLAWTSPERRRLDRLAIATATATATPVTATRSDSTFQSHAGDRDPCSCTDAFTDSEAMEAPTATTDAPPPVPSDDRSYSDSDPFSTSLSTAKEMAARPQEPPALRGERFLGESIERRVFERSTFENRDDRNPLPYDRPLVVDTSVSAAPYELLEIVVSESVNGAGAPPRPIDSGDVRTASSARDLDIDRYVSNILVESLNSLTDQLECMNASIGNDRKISIVEKEIKVRLQNTGVNTIVHLSPTSNHQIIFGNEELCNEMTTTTTRSRDECNNPLIRDEGESNDNQTPASPPPPPPAPAPVPSVFDALHHDNVNEAVLQQIQKLFRDELRHLHDDNDDNDDDDDDRVQYAADAISHIEISDVVDVYVDEERRVERADLIGGVAVGAGNYFCDSRDAAVVPRFSAFPHTESMEVNTSSSEDAELVGSECTSLVDSLDDPNSPRGAGVASASASARRRVLVRSAIDVLDLLPERERADLSPPPPPPPPPPEAFFLRIEDDRVEPDPDDVRVAECMPEKIKQRLYRRHRKRELRMECARRGKNQLKREVELRRREDAAAAARRRLDRECRALVDDLLDDIIAKIVHDEFKCMRIKRRNRLQAAKSDETLSRRTRKTNLENRRTSLETAIEDRCRRLPKPGTDRCPRDSRDGDVVRTERHHIHGKLLARPSASLASNSRPPRRFYQKSEIHEGDKCIEILEILEYVNVNGSQSSPDTTNSDESHGQGSRSKKSRIPVPVHERSHRSIGSDHMRLTGGDGGRSRAAAASDGGGGGGEPGAALAELLLEALADGPLASAEPRSRSNSLRFKRVFDIIPEERSSLSLESSASCEEVVAAAAGAVARGSRSAATSPPAAPAPRRLRDQNTMTSPYNKSAGTSPMRPPPPPPPREGYREVGVGPTESSSAAAAAAGAATAGAAGAVRRKLSDGDRNEKRDEPTAGERSRVKDDRPENPDRDEATVPVQTPRREGSLDRRLRREDSTDGKTSRTGRGRDGAPHRPPRRRGPPAPDGDSSDSGDSGGSLLCSLAPRWLSTQARRDRRRQRRAPPPAPCSPPPPPPPPADVPLADAQLPTGGWSVTVAGSCRAALPHDVEMRLRFPHEGEGECGRTVRSARTALAAPAAARLQQAECSCVECASCAASRTGSRPAPALPPPAPLDPTLTLTMKKEAQDSSIVASKTCRKSREHLPELETYRASRTKVKSSMKTRRGYSLHCWLPEDDPAPIRGSSGLSVLGCAIIPELKPRVPTMSERDLTRVYTPRHYLRS